MGILGTLLFTTLVFLLPTTAAFHLFFTFLHHRAFLLQGLLEIALLLLLQTPWYSIYLRCTDPLTMPRAVTVDMVGWSIPIPVKILTSSAEGENRKSRTRNGTGDGKGNGDGTGKGEGKGNGDGTEKGDGRKSKKTARNPNSVKKDSSAQNHASAAPMITTTYLQLSSVALPFMQVVLHGYRQPHQVHPANPSQTPAPPSLASELKALLSHYHPRKLLRALLFGHKVVFIRPATTGRSFQGGTQEKEKKEVHVLLSNVRAALRCT
jgi:hypothetical protein